METILTIMSAIHLSDSTIGVIIVAFLSLIGTIATVGYKYKKTTDATKDPNQIIFAQVNSFIEEQRIERDDLRKELGKLKVELAEVRQENRLKDIQIQELQYQIEAERSRYTELEKKFSIMKKQAQSEKEHNKTLYEEKK